MNLNTSPGSFEDSHPTSQEPSLDSLRHDPVGTPITDPPNESFRFLFINVQGFQSSTITAAVGMFGDECKKCHADYVGIAEPNIDLSQPLIRCKARDGILAIDRYTKMASSTTPFHFPSAYKPGGIMSFLFERACCRSGRSWSDPSGQGRYVVNTILGSNDTNVAIITAYQVHYSAPFGSTSIRKQRNVAMQARNPDTQNPDTRSAFWADIATLINNLRADDHKIILMGDFNESLYSGPRQDLKTLAETCGLVDPLQTFAPDASNNPTYLRGKHKIDYILVDKDIEFAVTGCGISAPNPGLSPSHRAIFCDISFASIFGTPASAPSSRLTRKVSTGNIPACLAMLSHLHKTMEANSLVHRCKSLLTNIALHGADEANGKEFACIDKEFRNALVSVERRGSTSYSSPWSKKLHESVLLCRYWKLVLQRLRFNVDCCDAITKLGNRFSLPTSTDAITITSAKCNLREAQYALREDRTNGISLRVAMLQQDRREALEEGDLNRAAMLNRIIRAEALHASYTKLRRTLNNTMSAPIDTIQTIQPDGTVKTTSKKSEMESLIMDQNRLHFSQAEGSPFTIGSLRGIEHTACCSRAESILDGTFLETDVSDTHLQYIQPLTNTPVRCTLCGLHNEH